LRSRLGWGGDSTIADPDVSWLVLFPAVTTVDAELLLLSVLLKEYAEGRFCCWWTPSWMVRFLVEFRLDLDRPDEIDAESEEVFSWLPLLPVPFGYDGGMPCPYEAAEGFIA